MSRGFYSLMMFVVVMCVCLGGCGGGGGTSGLASQTTETTTDPTAPTTPTGLTATQVNTDSVTLTWNAASGGNGGVYSYQILKDGIPAGGTSRVDSTTPVSTTCTVTSLQPSTTYSFTITATSLAGTSSAPSSPLTVTTASAASAVNKLLQYPYIVFDTSTGKIWSQCYISPGLMALMTQSGSTDLIPHQRVDATLYKITSQGDRQYAVSDINTGQPVEPSISAPPLLGNGISFGQMQKINMTTGALTSTVSAPSSGLLINIDDGGGAYLVGEAL